MARPSPRLAMLWRQAVQCHLQHSYELGKSDYPLSLAIKSLLILILHGLALEANMIG